MLSDTDIKAERGTCWLFVYFSEFQYTIRQEETPFCYIVAITFKTWLRMVKLHTWWTSLLNNMHNISWMNESHESTEQANIFIYLFIWTCFSLLEWCRGGFLQDQTQQSGSRERHIWHRAPAGWSAHQWVTQLCLSSFELLCVNLHLTRFIPSAPKAKRLKQDVGVVKRLFSSQQERRAPLLGDDITPPSSPEQYEPSHAVR